MGDHVVELNLRSCFNQFHFESNALLLCPGIHRQLLNLIHSLSFVFFSFGFLTPRKINCLLSKLASLYKLVSFFFEKATKIHSVVHCRESEFFHKKDSLLKSVGFSFRKNGNWDSFDGSFVNNNFWKKLIN